MRIFMEGARQVVVHWGKYYSFYYNILRPSDATSLPLRLVVEIEVQRGIGEHKIL